MKQNENKILDFPTNETEAVKFFEQFTLFGKPLTEFKETRNGIEVFEYTDSLKENDSFEAILNGFSLEIRFSFFKNVNVATCEFSHSLLSNSDTFVQTHFSFKKKSFTRKNIQKLLDNIQTKMLKSVNKDKVLKSAMTHGQLF